MEKIVEKIERTVTDTYTKYRAIDGTLFENEEACIKYDNTVEALLLSRVLEFQKKEISGDDLFESNSEGIYRIVVPTKESHIDTLNQLWKLYGGKGSDNLLFSDKDLHKVIAIGIRKYGEDTDWIWFWKINNVIEDITDNKYTVCLKDD